jgi:hypothetical protein
MKTKFQLGVLILLFAFFGTYVEYSSAPNQQIVIQFEDHSISALEEESAINSIREKLQKIGAEDIVIGDNEDGLLKITYYSDTAIELVQNILSQETDYDLSSGSDKDEPFENPFKSDQQDYKLNISEIQQSGSSSWDFEGTQIVEINHKSDRFNHLKVKPFANNFEIRVFQKLELHKLSIEQLNSIAIDRFLYKIPEVRAGPLV